MNRVKGIRRCAVCSNFEELPRRLAQPGDGTPPPLPTLTSGLCHLNPRFVVREATDWCSRWSFDAEKACRHESTIELRPALPETKTLTLGGLAWPGRPAQPAIYARCDLPKGHTGEHTDGIRSWK